MVLTQLNLLELVQAAAAEDEGAVALLANHFGVSFGDTSHTGAPKPPSTES